MINATDSLPEDAIRPLQAARLAGVRRETIWRWIQQGLLIAWRTPGGHYRISKSELLALFERIGQGVVDDGDDHRHGI